MTDRRLRQVDILELCQPYCIKYGVKLQKSDLSQYVSGKTEPGQDKLTILGLALGVSEAWLMGYDISIDGSPVITPISSEKHHFKKVPMLGYAAAGAPLEDVNQDIEYFDIDNKYDVDFCITVRGDSMINADINDGDVVFIKSMPEVANGKIACVEIDGERVCLKRFYKTETGVTLVSENPAYAPMIFNETNCESLRILGLAVLKQSEIQ